MEPSEEEKERMCRWSHQGGAKHSQGWNSRHWRKGPRCSWGKCAPRANPPVHWSRTPAHSYGIRHSITCRCTGRLSSKTTNPRVLPSYPRKSPWRLSGSRPSTDAPSTRRPWNWRTQAPRMRRCYSSGRSSPICPRSSSGLAPWQCFVGLLAASGTKCHSSGSTRSRSQIWSPRSRRCGNRGRIAGPRARTTCLGTLRSHTWQIRKRNTMN